MGAFATAVKAAGVDWESHQADQDAAFRGIAPLSADLAEQEAHKRVDKYSRMARMLGQHMRKMRPQHELETELGYSPAELKDLTSTPGREIMIPISGNKRAGAITTPLKHTIQDTIADIMGAIQSKKEEATKITEDPSTHPGYYPSLALKVPGAFTQGFKDEHKRLSGHVNAHIDHDLANAKAEFEAALNGSHVPGLAKTAQVFDALAEVCVGMQRYCGDMRKEAAGELNQVMNAYLGLATLLGSGTFQMGHSWAKKNDKNVQQLRAVKELMRQRAYMQPPVILTESGEPEHHHSDDVAPHSRKTLDVKYEPAKSESSETVNAI